MDQIIIIVIAILLAIFVVGFIWKLIKTVMKVVLVAVIAIAIFGLLANVVSLDGQQGSNNVSFNNISNSTNGITAQVTGFVSNTLEKVKLNAQKSLAEDFLEKTESDLEKLEN